MVVSQSGVDDRHVADLPEYFRAGDVLVVNDTRVIPARLKGRRGQAGIELLLHRPVLSDSACADDGAAWTAFARPAKRLKTGDVIEISGDFHAVVAGKCEEGEVELAFSHAGAALLEKIEVHGEVPLPPYIARQRAADRSDRSDYQTLYAGAEAASVAAPTAGLHFTPALMEAISAKGVHLARVTLHVGAGTFLPVKADSLQDHKMHAEWMEVSALAAAAINQARDAGGRVIAVGTTSLRALESAADEAGRIQPCTRDTDIFITPGYRFRAVDALLTNFHLPKSTLFMLVCAFSGMERMKAAYAHAIQSGYRFYSYGDACLLERTA